VRWEALFGDLQGQWDAAVRAEDESRIADLAEYEMGRVHLADRLRARRDGELTVRLLDGRELAGRVLDAAPQWLLLGRGERRVLVPAAAVAMAWPLGAVAPGPGVVESRLGVPHVLRAIAREGLTVCLRTLAGEVRGRIVRVGADHVDVAPDPARARMTVALAALLAVEST
jgi:hypothetical protein